MKLPSLRIRQLVRSPHVRQLPDPLLHLLPPLIFRRQDFQLVKRGREVRKQRVDLIHGNHIQLQSVHGGNEVLHALRHDGRRRGSVSIRGGPVLHGGGHPGSHEAVEGGGAVHFVGVGEALDAGDGVFERGS